MKFVLAHPLARRRAMQAVADAPAGLHGEAAQAGEFEEEGVGQEVEGEVDQTAQVAQQKQTARVLP